MNPEEFNNILSKLTDSVVNKTTISGNTIELWLDCEPGSPEAKCLWIDPPWRIEKNNIIVASSANFPWEKEEDETNEEYQARFDNACNQCHCIQQEEIETLSFCYGTADIKLSFKNGNVLRSFTTWDEEVSWHYSNYIDNVRYYVSAGKIEVKNMA